MSVDGVTFRAALEGLARGESLIAVGPDKKPWYSWGRYQLEAADERQLHRWARGSWTRAFAVVTGELSGVVVLDIDPDGLWVLEQLGAEPHVRTGRGGFHVRVVHPGFHVATINSKVTTWLIERWPGVDIRGDGGYAVEYGESSFGRYVHLRDLAELVPVSALPAALAADVGLLGPKARDRGPTGPTGPVGPVGPAPRTDGWVLEGHRHRHLLRIACAMRGRGRSADRMLAELRYVNATECRPPKDDALLVALVHDVVHRYPTDREKRAI